MASNSTSLSTAGGYTNGFTLSISWSENSTSVSNNTSNITATATLAKNAAIFWVTNAGALRCYWHDNHDNTDRLIAESVIEEIGYENNSRSVGGTFNATHNDDGTLKGYAWAQWEAWSSYGGYPPVSGSVATEQENLTTIARASAPTMSASSITIPASSGTITVNTNRASSSFTHTITLKVGNTTIATYTNVGASKTINIADIDDAILATIPSATTATVSVNCQTFSGSTSVGTKSTSFTANVGSGAKPTFSNFTYADTNSTTTTITGNSAVMISGKSALRATISAANKATAKYSATMVKYTFAIAGLSAEQAYSTSQITKDLGSPTVANTELPSGTRDLVITAIDSRGLSTSVTKTVTIVPYQAPIVNATATRANGFEDTTTVHIAGSFSWIEVSGTAKNTVNTSSGVAYRYKPQNSTSWTIDWTNKTATVNTTNGTVSVSNFTHELDNQTAYDFQFRIIDKLQTTTASLVVAIGQPAFYIGTDGRISVGAMPTISKLTGEQGLLEVAGRAFANGNQLLEDKAGVIKKTNMASKSVGISAIDHAEQATLVYMGLAGFNRRTYSNGYLVLENLKTFIKGAGVNVAISGNTLNLIITLPTTGTYVAEVYGQLWTNNNPQDYLLFQARKNMENFARAMAPKPNGSWAFVELTHPIEIANGDTLQWYLGTNGSNFSDGNIQIADSYTYLKIYKVAD